MLGFVKYLWRDAVSRIQKDNKALLITRLSSINVSGIGIAPPNGKTLVQYAKSLVGRDFCVVVQIAPFVLYDIIPAECYQTWLALSALVPLIWQPVINDLDNHIVSRPASFILITSLNNNDFIIETN